MSSTHDGVAIGETTTPAVVSFADQLRSLADLLDQHPRLGRYQTYRHDVFADSAEEAVQLRREIGGRWDKIDFDSFLDLEQKIGPDVTVALSIRREQACERVQVGEQTVEKPDPDAPMVTVTEPVYECRCSPLLEGAAS
jgi:hypothetical protein